MLSVDFHHRLTACPSYQKSAPAKTQTRTKTEHYKNILEYARICIFLSNQKTPQFFDELQGQIIVFSNKGIG